MLSALLMFRRFRIAMGFAFREEDFGRILGAAAGARVRRDHRVHAGEGWSIVVAFYVAVATLTTSSILDPKLTVTEPWLKISTALYVLVGIGIHVEVARRLGMGFIPSRDELAAEKLAKEAQADD